MVWRCLGGFVLLNGGYRFATGGVEGGTYLSGQMLALALGAFMFFAGIWTLRTGPVSSPRITSRHDFATRYTAAWCSQEDTSQGCGLLRTSRIAHDQRQNAGPLAGPRSRRPRRAS